MEKPMNDPVKEAIAKIPELRRRAKEILTKEPPAHITDLIPGAEEVVITEKMRAGARARDSADHKRLGVDY